jgi:hypothetical protein
MADPMAIEKLVSQLYENRGYITKLRYPYKSKKGANKDVDVICIKGNELLLISVKRVGSHQWFLKCENEEKYKSHTISNAVRQLLDEDLEKVIHEDFGRDLDIRGIVYYNIDPKNQPKKDWIEKGWIEIEIFGIHDLIRELFENVVDVVKGNKGSRYSDTGLELIRNMVALLRYDPDFIIRLSKQASDKIPVIQDGRIKKINAD